MAERLVQAETDHDNNRKEAIVAREEAARLRGQVEVLQQVSELICALPLAEVPPEVEWFANIDNPQTRRAYENALQDFMRFIGIAQPDEFREITRSRVIVPR